MEFALYQLRLCRGLWLIWKAGKSISVLSGIMKPLFTELFWLKDQAGERGIKSRFSGMHPIFDSFRTNLKKAGRKRFRPAFFPEVALSGFGYRFEQSLQ